jgi:hypothetical protein
VDATVHPPVERVAAAAAVQIGGAAASACLSEGALEHLKRSLKGLDFMAIGIGTSTATGST